MDAYLHLLLSTMRRFFAHISQLENHMKEVEQWLAHWRIKAAVKFKHYLPTSSSDKGGKIPSNKRRQRSYLEEINSD